MNPNVVVVLLGGLVLVGLVLGVILRATQTRVRTVAAEADRLDAGLLGAEHFGDRLTLVQFSTETCSRCRATARTLRAAAERQPGVAHVEIDVTHRDDLISRFSILRTPTVLVLDEGQRLRSRVSGPVGVAQALELIDAHLAVGAQAERSPA